MSKEKNSELIVNNSNTTSPEPTTKKVKELMIQKQGSL